MIKKYCSGMFQTNTYLVIDGTNCVIIDPGLGFEKYASEIVEKYDVLAILLTHGHIDHIDCIGLFSCPIYMSELDREFLKDETLSLASMINKKPNFNIDKLDIRVVHDDEIINIKDLSFKVIFTPGHTRGSVCYLYEDKLFSGDTLFCMSQGRTDFPTGDERKMRESLKKIISKCSDNVVVYPGHDEKTTIKNERKNNPYVIHALK